MYWREIQKQFDENEQELFLYHWSRIISQFRDDVLPTEELQVIDAIKIGTVDESRPARAADQHEEHQSL
jgi:hypothetical protein